MVEYQDWLLTQVPALAFYRQFPGLCAVLFKIHSVDIKATNVNEILFKNNSQSFRLNADFNGHHAMTIFPSYV